MHKLINELVDLFWLALTCLEERLHSLITVLTVKSLQIIIYFIHKIASLTKVFTFIKF